MRRLNEASRRKNLRCWFLPLRLDVIRPIGHEYHVEWTLAQNLVGQMQILSNRELSLMHRFHPHILCSLARRRPRHRPSGARPNTRTIDGVIGHDAVVQGRLGGEAGAVERDHGDERLGSWKQRRWRGCGRWRRCWSRR
jgi:hypothetical protein